MFTVIKILIIAVLLLLLVGYIAKAVMHAKAAGENLKEVFGKEKAEKEEEDS